MICLGGAVSHSYLFVVFPGQLELSSLAFQGAWCSGAPLHLLHVLPVNLEALPGWTLSVGSGPLTDGCVHLCTGVPTLPPTHLPSVCEINVVFVWVKKKKKKKKSGESSVFPCLVLSSMQTKKEVGKI